MEPVEHSAKTFCRLCFNVASNGNCEVIEETIREALEVLLKLNLDDKTKSVICTACSTKLFAALKFKTTCMNMEDNISPHFNSEDVTPVDLRHIYLKARGTECVRRSLSDDDRICRLCMQVVTSEFKLVEDVEIDMILKCIPEININATKEPVVCTTCLDSLNTHSSFLSNCLEVEKKIKDFPNNTDSPVYVKIEEVEMKSEVDDGDKLVVLIDCSSHRRHSSFDTNSLSTTAKSRRLSKQENQFQNFHKDIAAPVFVGTEGIAGKHEEDDVGSGIVFITDDESADSENPCNSSQDNKDSSCDPTWSPVCHQISRKNTSEIPASVYQCGICEFKSKHEGHLRRHNLIHKGPCKVQIHVCDFCDFKTRHKGHLRRHKLMHKGPIKAQVYICDMCHFKSKHMGHLRRHQLRHKKPKAETDMCDT